MFPAHKAAILKAMPRTSCVRAARVVLLALVLLPVSATVCLALCGTATGHIATHRPHADHHHAGAAAMPPHGSEAVFEGVPAQGCFASDGMLRDRQAAVAPSRLDSPSLVEHVGPDATWASDTLRSPSRIDSGPSPPAIPHAPLRPLVALRI
jgi:hypothetical protein